MHDLPFQSPTQFIALALTLIAGWLLGMASAPGGRKWRTLYEQEAGDHAGYRHQAETDLKEANRKIRDLEAECERLKKAATDAPATSHDASAG